jgi:hypothetical protein
MFFYSGFFDPAHLAAANWAAANWRMTCILFSKNIPP